MEYEVLSPWSEVDTSVLTGLTPRLDTLEGKTIGMYGDFMALATKMLHVVEEELTRRYPGIRFSYLQYEEETSEIAKDTAFRPKFEQWLGGVDAVLSFYGSVPSGALFLGYNSALMEQLGKPTVMLTVPRTYPTAIRGCKAKGVPGLRTVQYDVAVDKINSHVTLEEVRTAMAADLPGLTDALVSALTAPLTPEERQPTLPDQRLATETLHGTPRELTRIFYKHGWTNGLPIELPTREAVDEMMRGTNLSPDTLIGCIPPRMGRATVEKIAVNAVMAGCLPTYLPVLIAAVRGALDPVIKLEGWTCSQSTWGPVVTVSGSVARDIGLNTADHMLTPCRQANAAIARAFGYILMNIGGLRPGVEDLSEMGHEFRLGFCIGDDPDHSPWPPLHTDYGFAPEDSAVTMFWPQEHRIHAGPSVPEFLEWLCEIAPYGWDPGMAIIFTPKCAEMFAREGWTKQRVLNYVAEYARLPAGKVDLQWLTGNSHRPKNVELPEVMTHSTRIFWSTEHMFALVGGGQAGQMMTVLAGGGDHGGPSCTKIELPENWAELVREYQDLIPEYIPY